MKTIQQVLRETDHHEIETAYFRAHPIELMEVTDHDDLTIGEFKNKVSERFQEFLDRLCKQKIKTNEKDTRILFAYKSHSIEIVLGEAVGLIHQNELLNAGNVNEVPIYAYEFTEQAE